MPTATPAPTKVPADTGRDRTRLAAAPEPAPPRQQRRKSILGLGIALIVVGILAGAWYGSQTEEAQPVLVLSQPVLAGDALTMDHLRTTPFAAGDGVTPIPAGQVDAYVGQLLTGNLPEGTLLTPQMLSDSITLPNSTSLVGVSLTPAQMPSVALRPGDSVTLVMGVSNVSAGGAPGEGSEGALTTPGTIWPAEVAAVGPFQDAGLVTVDLAVPDGIAAEVAAAASSGNVSLVLHPHSAQSGNDETPAAVDEEEPTEPASDDAGQTESPEGEE